MKEIETKSVGVERGRWEGAGACSCSSNTSSSSLPWREQTGYEENDGYRAELHGGKGEKDGELTGRENMTDGDGVISDVRTARVEEADRA
jgi:hypothetical protein